MLNLIELGQNYASVEWEQIPPGTYACRAMVCEDEDGGFFAYATRLPGVVGEGETFKEAMQSVREGFESVMCDYLSHGEIPWQNEVIHEQGTLVSLSISVND